MPAKTSPAATKTARKDKPGATSSRAKAKAPADGAPAETAQAAAASSPTNSQGHLTQDAAEAANAGSSPAPGAYTGDNFVRLPAREDGEKIIDYVRRNMPFVVAAYALGHTAREIGESFDPQLTELQLRTAIGGDAVMHRQWTEAREARAHMLIDQATASALACDIPKERADTLIKVAEKVAPHLYGNKASIELSGPGGGPVESKVEMTPTEAYTAMLKARA